MARPTLIAGRIAAENRRARHDYAIESTLDAGIILAGTEVKALRTGRANLVDAFAQEKGGELFLYNAYIPEYQASSRHLTHEPRRPRKLLVHRRELARLIGAVTREGMTLVPLSIYFNERGLAKVQLALGKGKKLYDKRAAEKERDWRREKSRAMRERG